MLAALALILLGTSSACFSECNVSLMVSDTLSKEDKVLLLSEQLQQALFADKDPLTRIKIREVFFPSSKYRYWHVDNIEVIDIQACVTFHSVLLPESTNSSTKTECLIFRWTNSYFLNLIDIRQITYFEFVTVGALFSMIAHGYKDRGTEVNFTLSHNTSISSIEDTVVKQALIQFLSWSKLYARSEAMPNIWDEKDQGYATRKYDYTAVDLLLFDKQNKIVFNVTLTCFILCNAMATYLLLKKASWMYTRFCEAASQGGYRSSIAKGLLVLATLLVSLYMLAMIGAYSNETPLKFTRQCDSVSEYGCIPEGEFPTVHRTQVLSLVSNAVSVLVAAVLYAICSIYVAKTSECSVFKHSRIKWIEAYLFWNILMGAHAAIGLASIPLLIFAIMTPMYLVFYLSALTIGLAILLLPVAAAFHIAQQIKKHTQKAVDTALQVAEFVFVYLVGTGIFITLLFLYYLFLNGGASMNGVKGALYSLLPPIMISVGVFALKRKTSNERVALRMEEKEPLLINSISEHL